MEPYDYEQRIEDFDLSLLEIINDQTAISANSAKIAGEMDDFMGDGNETLKTRSEFILVDMNTAKNTAREFVKKAKERGDFKRSYKRKCREFLDDIAIIYNLLTKKQRAIIAFFIIYKLLFKKGFLISLKNNSQIEMIDKIFTPQYFNSHIFTSVDEDDEEIIEFQRSLDREETESPYKFSNIFGSITRVTLTSDSDDTLSKSELYDFLKIILEDMTFFGEKAFNTSGLASFYRSYYKDDKTNVSFSDLEVLRIENIKTFLFEKESKTEISSLQKETPSSLKASKNSKHREVRNNALRSETFNQDIVESKYSSFEDKFM